MKIQYQLQAICNATSSNSQACYVFYRNLNTSYQAYGYKQQSWWLSRS